MTVLVALILGFEEKSGIQSLSYMVALFLRFWVFLFSTSFRKNILGDAGAYLLGALVPLGLIKYTLDNEFSPWFVMAILIYPVTEVMVSIVRKALIRKKSALEPDGLHLHMLIYKKVTKRIGFKSKAKTFFSNYHNFVTNFPFMLLANFYKNDTASLASFVWYILIYLAIYFILPKYAFKNR